MKSLMIIFVSLVINLVNAFTTSEFNHIVIENASREVDLTQRYVSTFVKLKVTNQSKQPISSFYYSLPIDQIENVIVVLLKISQGRETAGQQIEDFQSRHSQNSTFYKFELETPIEPLQTAFLSITEMFVNRQVPFPKETLLNDNQLILYTDNVYFFSPYLIKSQSTIYKANNIISYPESDKVQKYKKAGLKFGEYSNVSPFSTQQISIHCENNSPLIYLTQATKSIQVSHWGNIAVESAYNLVNEGAHLKGEFSRVDFNKYNTKISKSALRSLSAELPYHARGVWYRDVIGNVSTSNAFRSKNEKVVKLNIQPRFPVMGGWKNSWQLGFNLNASRYLHTNNEGEFVLKQQFSIPFTDLLAQKYELRVVLPEGATDIRAEIPFSVDDQYIDYTYSYLDTQGRPTLVIKKKNVIDFHNQYFYVHYKLSTMNAIKKPLMLLAACLIFFFSVILMNRLSLKSLEHKANEKSK